MALAGIVCPKCGEKENRIVSSWPIGDGIKRRRECAFCHERFTTYECDNALMRRLMDRAVKIGYQEGREKAKNE